MGELLSALLNIVLTCIQENPGNSNSEGNENQCKLARVRVIEVDCKIQFSVLKIYSY